MATKGESAKTKFADLYADDQTDETGDPDAGMEGEEDSGGDYSLDECIADFQAALDKLKAKAGK